MNKLTKKLLEQIDPMDWYNLRYLEYIPDHFVQCKITKEVPEILEWVEANTKGRFGIAKPITHHDNQNIFVRQELIIGFEEPMEATLYTLSFT